MPLVLLPLQAGGQILVQTAQIVTVETVSPPVSKLTLSNGTVLVVALPLRDVQALNPV